MAKTAICKDVFGNLKSNPSLNYRTRNLHNDAKQRILNNITIPVKSKEAG